MPPDDAGQLETARALFDGGRLTQARQIAGLLKSELAKELDISAAAIGQFESGVTAALLGAMPAAVLGGVGTVAIALLWMKLFPTLRNVERLE